MFDTIHPVTLSKKAAAEVRKIMQTKNIPAGYGLRVGIKGGGCLGASPLIGFDTPKSTDLSYEVESITVCVDKRHVMYVVGKEVDFYEGDDARGFMFIEKGSGHLAEH